MLIAILVVLSALLLLMILRFVQPETIYSVRAALARVRIAKAFIDAKAVVAKSEGGEPPLSGGRASQALQRALVRNWRFESYSTDEHYVLNRITKLRELYFALTLHRPSAAPVPSDRGAEVCVIELGSLVHNLGRELKPNRSFNDKHLDAGDILYHIANHTREARGEPPLQEVREVETWFSQHPMGVRQLNELLIAAVIAMVYRIRRQNDIAGGRNA